MNAGAMWNYYMLQGGTNFGRTAGAGIVTSYDYDAPISGTCETRLLQCHLILQMCILPRQARDRHRKALKKSDALSCIEWGFPRHPKYGLLQQLHAALHKYEAAIVGNEPPQWWSQGAKHASAFNFLPCVSFLSGGGGGRRFILKPDHLPRQARVNTTES